MTGALFERQISLSLQGLYGEGEEKEAEDEGADASAYVSVFHEESDVVAKRYRGFETCQLVVSCGVLNLAAGSYDGAYARVGAAGYGAAGFNGPQ